MIPSVKLRIFDPFFANVYTQDASKEISSVEYSFDANGCAAATIQTTLRWEEVFARGYYQGRNGIEISTADDQLQFASKAGAKTLYVSSTAPYDASKTLAAAQIDIDDGVNPTYRVPVTGIGTNPYTYSKLPPYQVLSGGPYITVGAPIAGSGNNTSLPAYGAGATIYRRVYAGRIARRSRKNTRSDKMSFNCVGMVKRLAEVQINATFNGIDLGQAAAVTLANAANRFTDLVMTNPQVTIGTLYSGQVTNVDVYSFITSNLLATVASGDLWVLRVGHDRAPLITRLYTSSSNTYAFNVMLPQRAVKFKPIDVESDDEDISNMANSVLVIGDTDPITKQPIQGSYSDSTSIPVYGEIDGQSVSNVGVKDSTGASNYALGVLNSRSFPQASSSFELHVRNDNTALAAPASPIGLANGDVVYGYENLMVSGFDSTDLSPNKVPDSGLNLITGSSALWSVAGGMTAVVGSPNHFSGTSGYATSQPVAVAPGQIWTVGGVVDASQASSTNGTNPPSWGVNAVNLQTGSIIGRLVDAYGTMGASTTPSNTFVIPAGVYAIEVFCSMNGTPSAAVNFEYPTLNQGTVALPFVANSAAPNIYGLASSVVNKIDAAGDRVQTISFQPIEPDINASIAERVNAVVAQINATKGTPASIDQYCVSADLVPPSYTYSSSSLVVSFPAFLALFAKGSAIVTIPATNVTLPATATVYVFVNSSGTFITQANSSAPVAGAILIGYFTTNATGVLGDTFRASVGVIKIGVGNINVASNLPAPVASSGSITNGPSLNGIAADVIATFNATNVPQDATGILWVFRISGQTTWIPYGESNLAIQSGSSYPQAQQTVSFEYGDLTNGTSYDFGAAYVGLAGYGPVSLAASNFAAKAIAIPNAYLLQTIFTPTVSKASVTYVPSVNGVAANAQVTFTITNQPTDGSLARIGLFFHTNGSTAPYTAWATLAAQSGSSATYTFNFTDLTNGVAYDLGVSGINGAGGEGSISLILTTTAQTLAIATPYLLAGQSPTPTISSNPAPTYATAAALTGLASRLGLSFTITNQPTDGSLSKLSFYYRVTGTNWSPAFSVPVTNVAAPSASQAYYFEFADLTPGISYDFGVAFENAQGGEGGIGTILSNIMPGPIAIAAAYMLGGTAITPNVTNASISTTLSANGLNAAVAVTFTITNQPTDSSLSRVTYWVRPTALGGSNTIGGSNFNWSPYGGSPAVGVGSMPPPASGTYNFSIADLTGGVAYDFGVSFENAQGGESTIAPVESNYTAAVLNLPASANASIPSSIFTNGPKVTAASLGTQVNQGTGAPGQPFTFSIGDTLGGWFAGYVFYWRVHGDTTTTPHRAGSLGVTSTTSNIAASVLLGAGGTYDLGIAYEGADSTISAITWPSGLAGFTMTGISGASFAGVPLGAVVNEGSGSSYTVTTYKSSPSLTSITATISLAPSGFTDATWVRSISVTLTINYGGNASNVSFLVYSQGPPGTSLPSSISINTPTFQKNNITDGGYTGFSYILSVLCAGTSGVGAGFNSVIRSSGESEDNATVVQMP